MDNDKAITDEALATWRRMGNRSLLRSVAAVILGFMVITFGSVLADILAIRLTGLSPQDPLSSDFIRLTIALDAFVALGAGFLTAKAAPRQPILHTGVLALVLVFFATAALLGGASLPETDGTAPQLGLFSWYPWVKAGLGPAGVLSGGIVVNLLGKRGPF